jgi:DNA-binding CsgD family transcriptional regulator
LRRDRVHARVIVFIGDPEHEPRTQTESLHRRYGLTAAEARLAASFTETASLKVSAEALGITEGTARQYLKRIFQKTDTKSQAELMKLLVSEPAALLPR